MAAGRLRMRWMLGLGLIFNALSGLQDARTASQAVDPAVIDYFLFNLRCRFFVVTPAWLILLVLTFLRPSVRRMDVLSPIGIALGCIGLVLLRAQYAELFVNRVVIAPMIADQMMILLVTAVAVPMGFRSLIVTVVAPVAVAIFVFYPVLLPDRPNEWTLLLFGLFASISAVLLFAWWRESDDRIIFAQRDYAEGLNRRLEASNAELARLNTEKSEFMAIAAHDLRAPLATVRGFAELLRSRRLRDEAARDGALAEIEGQSARMLELVSNYLGAHAVESASLPLAIRSLDLADEIAIVARRNAVVAASKGQSIVVEPSAVTCLVEADSGCLAQILDNLFSNAIKFSPSGSEIRVRTSVFQKVFARIEVTHAGPGIPESERSRLFHKFGRTSVAATGGESSHGLGLSVVKRLVERMRGEVGVDSAPGHGSTFWFTLPRSDSGGSEKAG